MAKSSMNLQDSFLNQVRKDNVEIKMILLDGTTLVGTVRGFDAFTVILSSRGMQHLIYKHAIAQVISRRLANRREDGGEEHEERAPAPNRHNEGQESPKKESFNTLNLSRVVVSEDSER